MCLLIPPFHKGISSSCRFVCLSSLLLRLHLDSPSILRSLHSLALLLIHLSNRITAKPAPAAAHIAASFCGTSTLIYASQSFECVGFFFMRGSTTIEQSSSDEASGQGSARGESVKGKGRRCRQSVCLFRRGKCKNIALFKIKQHLMWPPPLPSLPSPSPFTALSLCVLLSLLCFTVACFSAGFFTFHPHRQRRKCTKQRPGGGRRGGVAPHCFHL